VETEATQNDPGRPDAMPADAAAEPSAAADGGDLAALNAQLSEANARAEDSNAKLLYALADFENFRKRSDRVLADRLAAGKRSTLAKFLPVLDNLQRALAFERDSDGLRGGLEATQRGFAALLESEGVRRIAVAGQPFDPRIAEAIGTRESDDADDDVVLEEAQPGYALGEDVLRPAQVIVSKRREST